jgi:hypothetical protein
MNICVGLKNGPEMHERMGERVKEMYGPIRKRVSIRFDFHFGSRFFSHAEPKPVSPEAAARSVASICDRQKVRVKA